jgi:hypothetical protein
MLSLPITHYKALKAELILQQVIEHLGVLTTIGVIDLVVRATEVLEKRFMEDSKIPTT